MVADSRRCGSLKTMSSAESFCPVTKWFKNELQCQQHQAEIRETDSFSKSARLLSHSGVTTLNPATTVSCAGPYGWCREVHTDVVTRR